LLEATGNTDVEAFYPIIFAQFLNDPKKIGEMIAAPGGGGGGGAAGGAGGDGAGEEEAEEVEEEVEEEAPQLGYSYTTVVKQLFYYNSSHFSSSS